MRHYVCLTVVLPPDLAAPRDDIDDIGDEQGGELTVPPVVAVVVTHNAGPALEACLASLRDQEYEDVSVLVIDTASDDDPTTRIASVLPSAYVRKLDHNPGFGAAVNDVLEIVEGAAFFLLCHDDVALEPDALRAMVEEAFRSNAGIVSPKVVSWDDEQVLLEVGMSIDKTGVPAPLVEPGELDQEQHDAVRDVFVAPGGCMLVRADLFSALGGFDPVITALGEDLDLCWRAQVAGARVIVVPSAVVRHQEALGERSEVDERRRLQARHRLRTMLTCYGPVHLLRVLPQAAFIAVVEIVYALLAGRWSHARDIAGAWTWNLQHIGEIRANRKRLHALRQIPDSEVRRLQVRGSARATAFVRGQIGGHSDDRLRAVTSASRELAGSLREGSGRVQAIVFTTVVVVLAIGSRTLVTSSLPGFGDLPAFPAHPWTLFSHWASGYRAVGLGSQSPAPTGLALLGMAGTITLGSMGALRRLMVIGLLPVGAVGMWRCSRGLPSRLARLIAFVAFLLMPLPYDAIARGRWGGLLLWSAAPWLVGTLARVVGAEPFGAERTDHRRTAVGLGLVVAVLFAFVTFTPFVVLVIALGLALGGLVTGSQRGGGRALAVAAGAAVVAFVVHVPWTLDFIAPGTSWSAIGGVRSLGANLSITDIVRFQTGPIGGAPLGWAFVVAAALPLLIGSEWRFAWAARAWVLALTCWSFAWLGQQPWFHAGLGPPEALLAPAAVALAMSIALGFVAFQVDLPGYRFGWRQAASVVAAAATALGALPILSSMLDGRWHAPAAGYDSVLGFMQDEQASAGPFRVLWIGDPDVLPVAGWQLRDGIAYGTTDHVLPTIDDRWRPADEGTTGLLADAVRIADRRETARLGRLLAPLGVRYVVVAEANAPFGTDVRVPPPDLQTALSDQVDLEEVSVNPSLRVFRNDAWAPTRALLPSAAASSFSGSAYFPAVTALDVAGVPGALPDEHGATDASGTVPDGAFVYVATPSSSAWSLSVDGTTAPRSKALGWANGFTITKGGHATLTFHTSWTRWLSLVVQVVLIAVAVGWWWRRRPRRATEVTA